MNFVLLDLSHPNVVRLGAAMLQARDAVERRSWSHPQEHTASGQGLLQRTLHKTEQTQEKSNMDSFEKMVKDRGIVAVAKAMVAEDRSFGLTETEFVTLATEDAVRKFPNKSPAAAFSQLFTDHGADGLTIRRAHRVVRDEQLGTVYAKADRSEGTAYNELMAKAAEYRSAHPELSISGVRKNLHRPREHRTCEARERDEVKTSREMPGRQVRLLRFLAIR